MQNTSLSPGILLRQRYRILGPLGEGGFGTVYQARDEEKAGRLVAIKELNMPAHLSAQEKIEITDSYNREVTLLSALRHRCLPRIYDHFTEPEHWYVVMEYLDGGTLEQHLHGQQLPLNEVLDIGIELCSVLDYLHQQKPPIIFRDVKPDNILLTPRGAIYLIDFGIARRYRTQQAKDTGALGSPGYAAPEQYGRAQTTPQTDIYGLGATLQTLLTGKDPLEIKISGWPSDALIPQPLQALLEQMMEPEISKRPQSMEAVRWQLSEIKQEIEAPALPPQTPPHTPAHYIPTDTTNKQRALPARTLPRPRTQPDTSMFWPGLRANVQSYRRSPTSATQLPPLVLPVQSPRPRALPNAPISWPDTPALPPLPAHTTSSKFWNGILNIIEDLDNHSFGEIWWQSSKVIFPLLFPLTILYFALVVGTYLLASNDWVGIILLILLLCIFCWIISCVLGCILTLCLKLLLRPFQLPLHNRRVRRIIQIRLQQQPPPHQF